MVKKEREGKVGLFGGRKSDEYTEKYQFITEGVKSAEDILRHKKLCDSDRIANIETGLLALNDMTPSEIKDNIEKRFLEALTVCRNTDNRIPIGCARKIKH